MTSPYGPLVTDEMLGALREFGNEGLQTPFTILRKEPIVDNPYGDDTEAWVDYGETFGWLKMTNSPFLADNNGLVGNLAIYRLELPHETDIRVGDMVAGEGGHYTVVDTNDDDTLQIWRTCIVRRLV